MDARGKFGEHERSVRVAWGVEKPLTNCFITLPIEIYDEKTENPGENPKKIVS